jgi:hypothetical protein
MLYSEQKAKELTERVCPFSVANKLLLLTFQSLIELSQLPEASI